MGEHGPTLHKLMRSWLLAEDPYGLNQRQEPTFDTPALPEGPPDAKRARNQGEKAVREELGVSGRVTPQAYDPPELVDKLRGREQKVRARDKIKAGQSGPAYSPEESAALAKGLGTSAVEGAVGAPAPAPFPLAPSFPMPMTPPGTYFGPDLETERAGGWRPGEASAAAKSLGRNAVERELGRQTPEE